MRLRHPFRVPLAIVAIAVSLAGCDNRAGGNERATVAESLDSATVAAGLRHYFATFNPEDGVFPTGAGPPRVKDNGCKHQRSNDLEFAGPDNSKTDKKVAFWRCSVRFQSFSVPVAVAVNERGKVVFAAPVYGDSRNAPPLSPARTYTG